MVGASRPACVMGTQRRCCVWDGHTAPVLPAHLACMVVRIVNTRDGSRARPVHLPTRANNLPAQKRTHICSVAPQVLGPLSTLTNWVSEFERWAPGFPVVLYHGSKQERQQIRSTRMPTGGWGCGPGRW